MSDSEAESNTDAVDLLFTLKERGEQIEKKRGQERVRCPECETVVWKGSVSEAVETAETHDEKRHDGERTATVNGMLPPSDKVAGAAKDALEKLEGSR